MKQKEKKENSRDQRQRIKGEKPSELARCLVIKKVDNKRHVTRMYDMILF